MTFSGQAWTPRDVSKHQTIMIRHQWQPDDRRLELTQKSKPQRCYYTYNFILFLLFDLYSSFVLMLCLLCRLSPPYIVQFLLFLLIYFPTPVSLLFTAFVLYFPPLQLQHCFYFLNFPRGLLTNSLFLTVFIWFPRPALCPLSYLLSLLLGVINRH